MGVSVSVIGVRKKDEEWAKMAKVKEACDAAGISLPDEAECYFECPDSSLEENYEAMREIDLSCLGEGSIEYGDGFRIDLDAIPKGVFQIIVRMR